MNNSNSENSQVDFFALISLSLIFLAIGVFSNHGINTEQFITILRILIWPSIAILALRNNLISGIINRLSGLEFPGGKATFHNQQDASEDKEIEPEKKSTEIDTSFLDGYLVQNSRNALLYFHKHSPVSLDIFLDPAYKLEDRTNREEADEKWVIFGVLLKLDLIEYTGKTIKTTKSGEKYLSHLKLI